MAYWKLRFQPAAFLSASDFQSEVGEVFGEIGGELPAKFGRRFSSFFCWGKSSEAFFTETPPQISPSNFTTRFWVVAGPAFLRIVSIFYGRFLAERIFRGFLFLGRRIFSRIFAPDFFFSFLWEKVPRKSLQENPRQNPPKFKQQKSPTHFCRGAGPIFWATKPEWHWISQS